MKWEATHSAVQLLDAGEQSTLVLLSHDATAARTRLLGHDSPHGLDDADVVPLPEPDDTLDSAGVLGAWRTALQLQSAADRLDRQEDEQAGEVERQVGSSICQW